MSSQHRTGGPAIGTPPTNRENAMKTGEHVMYIEYRIRVRAGPITPPNNRVHPCHAPAIREGTLTFIKSFMEDDVDLGMRAAQPVPSDFELKKDEERTAVAVKKAKKPLEEASTICEEYEHHR
jgi:hypothetical protein